MIRFYPSLPWGPFRSYVDRWVEHHAVDGRKTANLKEIAAAVDTTFTQVRRSADTGRIAFMSADRWACRLGVHPSVIWGEDYWIVSNSIDQHDDEMMHRRQTRRGKSHAA